MLLYNQIIFITTSSKTENIKINTKIILRSLNYFKHSFKPKGGQDVRKEKESPNGGQDVRTKKESPNVGQDVRTPAVTTHHTHNAWPKIFDNGQKQTVEFRTKLSF